MLRSNILSKIKAILEPIQYSKKYFSLYFLTELYDGFQSVFVVVIMSSIVMAIETKDIPSLYYWTYVYMGIAFVALISSLFQDSFNSTWLIQMELGIIKKYLGKYIYLDNTQVEKYGTGKINNIIFKGISANISAIGSLTQLFIEIASILYIFIEIILRVPNFYYFLGFLGFFLLIIGFFYKGIAVLSEVRKQAKHIEIQTDGRKVKILMSKFEILQNKKIDQELSDISDLYKEHSQLWWYGNLRKASWQSVSMIITQTLYIVLFLSLGVGIISGNYTMANFTLLIWLLQIVSRYTWNIRGYMRDIFKEYTNLEKLWDFFETIPEVTNYTNGENFVYKAGDIEFRNVSFGYEGNKKVLEGLNVTIIGGKKTAFVGNSGGGKTTLIKLIAGYIQSDSGNIIIDGQDMHTLNLQSYYKNIGYLTQEPSIFDGTIRENLAYALSEEEFSINSEESFQKMNEIIRLAKCEFIYEFKNGLDTEIGERGVRLSGGQKQRLAIAKIMLKNPKIILLDEPTSALDSFNEEQISIALHNLFIGKTVIVIAHRLQTVKEADEIIVIDQGKILERGNHEKLIQLGGRYKKMLDLQSGF